MTIKWNLVADIGGTNARFSAVPVGELDPNHIHIPGIFVQRIFQGEHYEKRIEQRTVRKKS